MLQILSIAAQAAERIYNGIAAAIGDEERIRAVLDPYNPKGSTRHGATYQVPACHKFENGEGNGDYCTAGLHHARRRDDRISFLYVGSKSASGT